MVAARRELEPHPLAGLQVAYYICMREPLAALPRLRRWLIRFCYFRCSWASDYCIHDQGIFIDREVAEEVARIKSNETGKSWSVKELPVNALLPELPVRYGFYSFPASDINTRYRNRRVELLATKPDFVRLNELKRQIDEILTLSRT